jgi:hypothetical protein
METRRRAAMNGKDSQNGHSVDEVSNDDSVDAGKKKLMLVKSLLAFCLIFCVLEPRACCSMSVCVCVGYASYPVSVFRSPGDAKVRSRHVRIELGDVI